MSVTLQFEKNMPENIQMDIWTKELENISLNPSDALHVKECGILQRNVKEKLGVQDVEGHTNLGSVKKMLKSNVVTLEENIVQHMVDV